MSAPSILIATPVYGTPDTATVSAAYHMTLVQLLRDPHFHLLPAVYGCDLVRGRSRLVRQFLEETACTHMLFWDEDIAISADQAGRLITRMVESGHDFVACTYPKKRLRMDKVEENVVEMPIADRDCSDDIMQTVGSSMYEYAFAASEARPAVKGCVEVEGVPLGFAMCSRAMLQRMVDAHSGTLTFTDVVGEQTWPTVALFQLAIEGGKLLGEDYSFCSRWRRLGGKVQLYVGPDCELGHVGAHLYQGRRDGYAR